MAEGSSAGTPEDEREGLGRRFAVVVLVALAARLLVFAIDARHDPPADFTPDTASYIRLAEVMRGAEDAEQGREHRAGERTPGYPALMALCFELGIGSAESPRPVLGVQILLGALAAGFAAVAAQVVAGPAAGLATGLLAALEPSGLAFPNVLLSETLYTVLVSAMVGAWAALAMGGGLGAWLGLAAALALAPLVKPVAMFLPVVLVPFAAWALPRTPGGRKGLIALLGVALAPSLLWSARNHAELGHFTLSRQGPLQQAIFAYDVERALGLPEPPPGSPEAVWEFNYGGDLGLSRDEIDERRSAFVRRVLLAHPFVAARLALVNFVEMAGVPDSMLASQVLEEPPAYRGGSARARLAWLVELRALGVYLLLGMILALSGLAAIPWLAWRARGWAPRRRAAVAGVAFLILYQLALSSFVTGQAARYRAPVMPALAALAVLGVLEARRARGEPGGGRLAAGVTVRRPQ